MGSLLRRLVSFESAQNSVLRWQRSYWHLTGNDNSGLASLCSVASSGNSSVPPKQTVKEPFRFSRYIDLGIFGVSPFETIDREGVGRLVDIAVREGRQARPELEIGVCGEHGGDPDSVHFFHQVGLDYVSCSPFRVPIARLEAGRAALAGGGSDSR